MPPTHIEANLGNIIDIVPDLCEDLLQTVDQPLKVQKDATANNREYLICDYNRDGDSYRSPWSNKYDPPLPDGCLPSDRLREMEVIANGAFDAYRDLYYGSTDGSIGVSSVYFWDLDEGFAMCALIKKSSDPASARNEYSSWDSIHVVEVVENAAAKSAKYKLTTTVMLALTNKSDVLGSATLCGNLTKRAEQDCGFTDNASHITNIGRMIENMESKLREELYEIYFSKTREVVDSVRSLKGMEAANRAHSLQAAIMAERGSKA
jgi:capping protein beta